MLAAVMGEVKRLGDGDQFFLRQRQPSFECFNLGVLVEDGCDQLAHLTIGVRQERI